MTTRHYFGYKLFLTSLQKIYNNYCFITSKAKKRTIVNILLDIDAYEN